MPFYRNGTKLETKSGINQGKQGNCYVVAAVAAYSLCFVPAANLATVVSAVGFGMGGNSDRAFKAMGLYSFSKSIAYKGIWKQLITRSVDRGWPVCLGISWRNMDRSGQGNHVVYVTGYEGNTVYARDQQNGHVLISVVMEDPWLSDEFVAGLRTSREATVSWVGVGCPSRNDAALLL